MHVGKGRFELAGLDIMFVAIKASCSAAVRAMRACAQGGSRDPFRAERSGGAFPPPKEAGGFWGRAALPTLFLSKLQI